MFPINCKHSFITVSDTIYSVLNCTNWNFIINTLHTCFKLINIFKFMSLAFFIPHTISIGSMSGEWGGLVSISQLLYNSSQKKVQVKIKMNKIWFLLIPNNYFVGFKITSILVWRFAIIICLIFNIRLKYFKHYLLFY